MDFLCFSLNATSGAKALTSSSSSATLPGGEGEQIRVFNLGPNKAAVLVTLGAATAVMPTDNATANGKGVVIPAGGVETFTIGNADTISGICASTETATIYFSRGKGA